MEILGALEASGFAMWVKESSTAYVTVLALHTIGMAFLVGISGATAMRVLGVARAIPLAPMEDFFPLMYAGFWINAATGTVLLALYPTKFLTDPTFYIKIAAIVVALVVVRKLGNLVFDGGASLATAAGSKKAKMLSVTLLAVWVVATTAGRLTAYTLPTKIQTAVAVLVFAVVALLVGYVGARSLGWIKRSEKGVRQRPSVF